MLDNENHKTVKAIMDELSCDITKKMRFVDEHLNSLIIRIDPHFEFEENETKELFDRISRVLQWLLDNKLITITGSSTYGQVYNSIISQGQYAPGAYVQLTRQGLVFYDNLNSQNFFNKSYSFIKRWLREILISVISGLVGTGILYFFV